MNTTIQQEEQKKLPQLVKGSSTYKLIVPKNVEEKIRYLIRKFPSTEWSGVLFYTHIGSFEDDDLVITCKDIYPMDLGTSGWTEFKMSEDVAAYMAENIELFDCETGLVHSHHQLGAFFSSQDNLMLQQEGNDTNCFVSLVVDTPGNYVARITRKIQTKSEVTIKRIGTSYEFFGDGNKDIAHDGTTTTKVIDKEVIEYFDLEVERHEVQNNLSYLDNRFDEIIRKKNEVTRPHSLPWNRQNDDNKDFDTWLHLHDRRIPFNQYISPNSANGQGDEEALRKLAIEWQPDGKKIHKAVVNVITCNLIINADKFDLKQWVYKHMVNVYKRIFGEESLHEAVNEASGAFCEWKDFIIQFTIDNFSMDNVPDAVLEEQDVFQSRIASAMLDEIKKYESPNNPYITSYCNALELYIVE